MKLLYDSQLKNQNILKQVTSLALSSSWMNLILVLVESEENEEDELQEKRQYLDFLREMEGCL